MSWELAQSCIRRGWAVFPVRDKKPLIRWKEGAVTTWTCWPEGCDVGLPTGERNGIVVVDDDRGKHGLSSWAPPVPTYNVPTRSGGRHYYFAHPGGKISNSASKIDKFVDVRGDGGYVVVYDVNNAAVTPLPEGLIPAGKQGRPKPFWIDPARRQLTAHMLMQLPPWPQGERNFTLFKMACEWLENDMDVNVLYQKALQSGVHPEEAERTLASARARVVN